jgi:hypothetical protein
MTTWRPRQPSQKLAATALVTFLSFVLAGAFLPGEASAHFNKDVGNGQYRIQMGFQNEPTFAGQPNAFFLKVEQYATGGAKPVDDLASTLTAEVTKDGQTYSQPLVPIGDGQYVMPFVPTATGDYTFHVSGKIGDAAVDESATSGPNTFDTVQPLSAIEFPASQPDASTAQAADAQADAAMARTLAIAGIAVGALGLIVGFVALTRSGRPRTEVTATPIAVEPSGKLLR